MRARHLPNTIFLKEAATATITLNDDDPATVRRMFCYLYTLDYDDGDSELVAPQQAATEHHDPKSKPTQAVGLALTQPLETQTSDEASNPGPDDKATALHDKVMSNVYVYAIAEKYEILALKELARAKFQTLSCTNEKIFSSPTIIDTVFGTTPEMDWGLRSIVIEICAKRVDAMLTDTVLYDKINEHGDLGLGILCEVIKQRDEVHKKHAKEIEKRDEASKKAADEVTFLRTQKVVLRRRLVVLKEGLSSLHNDSMKLDIAKKIGNTTILREFEAFQIKLRALEISVVTED